MANIFYNSEARIKLKAGVDKVANAVKVTLGAKGRNVTIERELLYGPGNIRVPIITKDGVTVSMSIKHLSDPVENLGALMVKDAAEKTMTLAGDGTTTATLLAQAIFTKGMEFIDQGANPMDLKRGIDKAVVMAVSTIRSQSIPIGEDPTKLYQIANISANGDADIAAVVSNTFSKVGKDGFVTYAKSQTIDTHIELSSGMKLDRGYLSPYFITNKAKAEVEFNDAMILIFDKKISKLQDISHILETMFKNNKPLLIIAEDIDGDALHTIIANVVKNESKFCAIRHPFGGTETLEDIAVMTGGTVLSEKKGHSWKTFNFNSMGSADSIKISADSTRIIGGRGDKTAIAERIENVRQQYADSDDASKGFLQQRLSNISNTAAIIHIGGQTEVEVMERKDRIDDAVCATRAAMEEGIVPGGGMSFFNAAMALNEYSGYGDEGKGFQIVAAALQEPAKQIMLNGGYDYAKTMEQNSVVTGNPAEVKDTRDVGFNVVTGKWEKFFQSGIIDPAKVSRVALENAASVAGMLLTTECAIVAG